MKSKRNWVIVGAIFLVVAALLYAVPSEQPARTALVQLSVSTPSLPIEVVAQLDTNVLSGKGVTEPLRVTVTNSGTGSIDLPKLQVIAPGFVVKRDNNFLPIFEQHGVSSPTSLAQGQKWVFEIPLTTAASSGKYSITSLIYPNKLGAETKTLTLGPVLVDGLWGASRWTQFLRRFQALCKDLTLPLLLAYISYRFKKAQDKREKKLRDSERERTEAHQVKQVLLPRVIEYAESFYMPIVAASTSAVRELQAIKEKGSANGDQLDRATYFLLKVLQLFTALAKSKGGLFLQSHEAEQLIQQSWVATRIAIDEVFSMQERALVEKPDLITDLNGFQKKRKLFSNGSQRLLMWVLSDPADNIQQMRGSIDDYLGALDVMQAILRYEVNRPLAVYWYSQDNLGFKFILKETKLPDPKLVPASRRGYLSDMAARLELVSGRKVSP